MIKELKEFARRINILSADLNINISESVADILVFRNEIHNIKTQID